MLEDQKLINPEIRKYSEFYLARQGKLTGDHYELKEGRKSVMWVSYPDFEFPRNQEERRDSFFKKREVCGYSKALP